MSLVGDRGTERVCLIALQFCLARRTSWDRVCPNAGLETVCLKRHSASAAQRSPFSRRALNGIAGLDRTIQIAEPTLAQTVGELMASTLAQLGVTQVSSARQAA